MTTPRRFTGHVPRRHYGPLDPVVYVRDVLLGAYLEPDTDEPTVVAARLDALARVLPLALSGDLAAFQRHVADDPHTELPEQMRGWLRDLADGTASWGVPVEPNGGGSQ